MQVITHFLSQGFSNIAPFFILLGLLIFVHELGHFLVARWCGVRVETFSLGFGKKVLSYKPGDTTYCVSIIPLGGYVKMYGDDPTADIPVAERGYSFLHKKVWQRIAIVLAGPLMNLFFAIVLFMAIGRIGEELPAPRLGDVVENTDAAKAGFHTGDKVLKINGEAVQSWLEVQSKIETSASKALNFEVERVDKTIAHVTATPKFGSNENILSTNREVGKIDGFSNESVSAVVGVKADSPAAKAGINTLDLILAVNDQVVNTYAELDQKVRDLVKTETGDLAFKVRFVDAEDKPENTRVVKIPAAVLKTEHPLTTLGVESAEMYILKVKPDSPAAQAGMGSKDRIVSINNEKIENWNDVLNKVKGFTPGTAPIHFTVLHDGQEKQMDITPEMTELMSPKGQEEKRYTIGVISGGFKVGPEPVQVQIKDPGKIFVHGFQQAYEWTGLMVMSLVRLAQGQVSAKNIGGVITIGRVASKSFEVGISAFLKTMAIISINLFLLNLLPVPVLDGGHLLFFSLEALRGTPISLKKLEIAQQVGLTLLMMLMAFAFFNDISNFFTTRW